MDDAFAMRGGERVGEGDADVEEPVERQSTAGQGVLERSPLDQLHGHERHAVRLFDREDGDDVRMVEGGDGPGLAPEAGQALWIGGDVGGQNLERDIAAEPVIVGPIHLAHAAAAKRGDDPVCADRRSRLHRPGFYDASASPHLAAADRALLFGSRVDSRNAEGVQPKARRNTAVK